MFDPVTLLDVIIPHKAFDTALARIELFQSAAKSMTEPLGLALLGPSGSGKSCLQDYIYSRNLPVETDDGTDIPIVRVSVPSKPTIKSLGERILKSLDADDSRRYTEGQMTDRILTLMKNCHTDILMVNEFQHFYDKTSHLVWHHVADWLKGLLDGYKKILVVAGLPYGMAVIEQNEQLAGRFRAPMLLPRFSWQDPIERGEFIACLVGFGEVMAEHFSIPPLEDQDDWAFRCYCGTGGLVGYLKRLLSEVVLYAAVEKKKTLTLEHFDAAFKRYACLLSIARVRAIVTVEISIIVCFRGAAGRSRLGQSGGTVALLKLSPQRGFRFHSCR